jgi:predicted small lipoprotein YifL
MKAITARVLMGCVLSSSIVACGQKGPLYLPDRTGTVVERPAAATGEAQPEKKPASEEKERQK